MKIVFASTNSGKIRELQSLLDAFELTVVPQSELGVSEIPETGLTFVENALLKARHACQTTGFAAIADDSGLVVPALDGAPGIYSARFAGEKAEAKDNTEKLLHVLKNVPDENRHAYYFCALVYMTHATDPTPIICQGLWHGKILSAPQGENGFGYDPVFFDAHEKMTAAELSLDIKNRISHRGQALRSLMQHLPEKINNLCKHSP